jgi:hypothetical protein
MNHLKPEEAIMYGAIFQSSGNFGIRQTVVIPNVGEPFMFTRVLGNNTKMRGSAGAWLPVSRAGRDDLLELAKDEIVLGRPVARQITDSDHQQFANEGTYRTLLQKLGRAVQEQTATTDVTFDEQFGDFCRTVDHKPEHLVRYAKSHLFAGVKIQRPEPVVPVAPQPIEVEDVTALAVTIPATPQAEAEQGQTTTTDKVNRVWAKLAVPAKPHYLTRNFDGIDEDTMYDLGIANGDAFLLSGHAGVGKTESTVHLASRLGVPWVRVEMHQSLSIADIEGRLMPNIAGGWDWHYSRLATAIRQPSVILLNELSRSLPSNTTLFLGLLNEKVLQIESLGETIPVHPECIFIADQNIGRQYVGTREQDPALLDRFNVKLEFDDDPVIEGKLIPSPALLELATALRFLNKQEPAKHRTRVGLRMLLNFVKQAKTYNFTFAVNRFLANFSEAEREAVAFQFETRYINIANELAVPTGDYSN